MIQPDDIVEHVPSGVYYRVRSVSKTKAVVNVCTKTGKPPAPGRRAIAIEFEQSKLRLVRKAN